MFEEFSDLTVSFFKKVHYCICFVVVAGATLWIIAVSCIVLFLVGVAAYSLFTQIFFDAP